MMTPEERAAEDAASRIPTAAHLERIAKAWEQAPLTVGGFTECFTEEHRRNMREAVDLLERTGADASETIMWKSETPVGLQTMIDWLIAGGLKRQRRFRMQAFINPADYATIEEMEADFANRLAS